ncbi:MAG: thiamine pyrophosphate-binding protein [Pseudomonas marincola]
MNEQIGQKMPAKRTGGQILADQLAIQGVDRIFCVPGESYIALLDGLHTHKDTISVVQTRHEGGASNMAEAYGKLTGKPGICMVTRAPGATNASCGVHTAFQDSTPMVLLIGQVAREMVDREAFQEIDYTHMFGQMSKWTAQINDIERIPEYISHAFHMAQSGRPGPVVLALPEDMLAEAAVVLDIKKPARPVQSAPAMSDIAELRERLDKSKRPFLLIGGATWTAEAVADITKFAEDNGIPVGASLRSQDCMDNRHANYVGDVGIAVNPLLSKRIKQSDLLIVAGPRLGEMTTQGYDLVNIPEPEQSLVHIHCGVEELGRVYRPDLAISSTMPRMAAALCQLEPVEYSHRTDWLTGARADYIKRLEPTVVPGDVNMAHIVGHLNDTLDDDAIITVGAGNYTVWVHRYYQHKSFRTQLAPTSGSMGYSVPAAISAKLTCPERTVVSFNGDGCFMMLGQELATAAQFGAAAIFIIVNNGMYGTIRMHQERHFPTNVIATDLVNPDFVKLAEAYGAHGERVTRTEEFADAFDRAKGSGRPAVIEIVVVQVALTPIQSLSDVREQGKKLQAAL